MSIEAMKMALEALEQIKCSMFHPAKVFTWDPSIIALRAAIEQGEKPVAWMYDFMADNRDEVIRDWMTQDYADIKRENGFNVRPLYAAPSAIMQKPVAYADSRVHGWPDCFVMEPDPPHTVPLYAAPRQWVGLTDEEIKEIIGPWGDTPIKGYTRKLFDQIEEKLREKNHAG
jgi:hypothetical protein